MNYKIVLSLVNKDINARNAHYWLRSTSEYAPTAGLVSGDQIAHLMARFNAGKEFKRVLRSVKFEKKPRRKKSSKVSRKT